jgi:hypothetical protein
MKSEIVLIEIEWDTEMLYEELDLYEAEEIIDSLPSESICKEDSICEHLDWLSDHYGCLAIDGYVKQTGILV